MGCSELHCRIDILGRGESLVEDKSRFVNHWHQHPIDHKTRAILDTDRCLSQIPGQRIDCCVGLVRGLQSPNHFDQRHQWYRVEKMHADDALSAATGRCDPG